MLVWNAITQIEYVYVVFVDAIALDAIGKLSPLAFAIWNFQADSLLGYKYYAVYMPLVIIQWLLIKFCMTLPRP